jgi:hypothetical protein
MHPPEVKAAALTLIEQGHNDCEVSRITGIARTTIRDWRSPAYVPQRTYPLETCPRCWRAAKPMRFTAEDYSELLGLYLGDGYISEGARTQRMRIALDMKYPGIIRDARSLLSRCFPHNDVDDVTSVGCIHVSLYSSHLSCLFPQHGSGRKHERPIVLEAWQRDALEGAPWRFIRGCIRTDGCAFINRTDVHRDQPYEYLSYDFSNKSADIIELFMSACELVGIDDYRANRDNRGQWHVRINRRGSVGRMLANVGLKA